MKRPKRTANDTQNIETSLWVKVRVCTPFKDSENCDYLPPPAFVVVLIGVGVGDSLGLISVLCFVLSILPTFMLIL